MKKKISLLRTIGLLVIGSLLLTACDKNMPQTQKDLDRDTKQAEKLYANSHKIYEKRSLVEYTDDIYVAGGSRQIEHRTPLPPVFGQTIIYSSSRAESVTNVLVDVYTQTDINFKFTPDAVAYIRGDAAASPVATTDEVEIGSGDLSANVGALSDIKMNMQYSGPFEQFVERIGTQFDLYWEYAPKEKTVIFFRTQTKVLALDLLPGLTTFENTLTSSSTVGGSEEGANLNSGAVMTVNYKNDQGNPWDDTINTITAMLSTEGRVSANMRTGYVTVSDIPERVYRVEGYINKINDKARKKIAIKVDVFDVTVDHKTDYGLNWDAIISGLGGKFTLNSGTGASPLNTLTDGKNLIKFFYDDGGFFDTAEAIFRALSQVGDTSKVTGTTVYTVNGEPAPVQVVTREDYIKEVSFTAVSENSSTTEVSVTPGTVISGFFMVLTPNILSDSQILLNMSMSISTSDLTNQQQVNSGSGDNSTNTTITLPKVQSKNFMESVTLNPGETVILSGFQEVENKIGIDSFAAPQYWALGGNKAANLTKTITVTVITPYIIGR